MSRTDRSGLPAFVSIGHVGWGPGHLGIEHTGFVVHDPERRPANVDPAGGGAYGRFDRRLQMLEQFEAINRRTKDSALARDRASARRQALALMRSSRLRAFDLSEEPAKTRDQYGRHKFGQGCLLARRLVDAGVRFVQVHFDGWDSHVDNFIVHDQRLATLDQALAALLDDLGERGLDEHTAVLCMGEFGRTPKINKNQGRDHHPSAYSVVLAGAGIRSGVVHGQTDKRGALVVQGKATVPDLLATVCRAVGVNPDKEFKTTKAKPVRLVDGGKPIAEVLESS
jgi:uncharacterized protein (DUF1501 family)